MTDTNLGLRTVGNIHGRVVHDRRIAVLAGHISRLLSPHTKLLDIGCGDGRLAALLTERIPQLEAEGVELLPREDSAIPCRVFDGLHLPFPNNSFDCCLFVDVLHHTTKPLPLLQEACRVSDSIIIKDHLAESALDHKILRFMDWVGNRPHGVVLPYAYLSSAQWSALYAQLGLIAETTDSNLQLYPPPFSFVFGRKLHFISLLRKA